MASLTPAATTPTAPVAAANPTTAMGLGTLSPGTPASPMTAFNSTNVAPLTYLNQALTANNQAYGGQSNQLAQQYQQNAGNVQQNLINSGLGNTTVAQNMAQAPLQSYNNAMLNLLGQQQGAAAGIYGQGAGYAQQTNMQNLSDAFSASQQQSAQAAAQRNAAQQAGVQSAALGAQQNQNAMNSLANQWAAMQGGNTSGAYGYNPSANAGGINPWAVMATQPGVQTGSNAVLNAPTDNGGGSNETEQTADEDEDDYGD